MLLPERQLMLKIGDLLLGVPDSLLRVSDLLLRVGQLPVAFHQRATQPLILPLQALRAVRVALPRLRPRHALHGTLIASTCTAP